MPLSPEDLRELRSMAAITVADFAVLLNVDPDHLGEMMRGRRPIPARFESEAFAAVDDCIRQQGDGPA